jgi:hypothetical protein
VNGYLGLKQILRQRIREIHETIGGDSSILEANESLNEQAMYAIYEGSCATLETLEEDPDEGSVYLAEAEEMLRILRQNDPDEYTRIATLPDGLRSARRSKTEGLFLEALTLPPWTPAIQVKQGLGTGLS